MSLSQAVSPGHGSAVHSPVMKAGLLQNEELNNDDLQGLEGGKVSKRRRYCISARPLMLHLYLGAGRVMGHRR